MGPWSTRGAAVTALKLANTQMGKQVLQNKNASGGGSSKKGGPSGRVVLGCATAISKVCCLTVIRCFIKDVLITVSFRGNR